MYEMFKFYNDYSRSAHPKIIEALSEDMHNSYAGYGLDSWCERASEEIRKAIGKPNANMHYIIGGTQTNMTEGALKVSYPRIRVM